MNELTPEEIVADMVARFKKWNARGTPLPVIMNKIFVNVKAQLAKCKDRPQPGEQRIRELLWATHPCEGKYGDDGELQCNRFFPLIDTSTKFNPDEIRQQTIDETLAASESVCKDMIEQARKQEQERILKLLPEITKRFDHNKTCFDCIENIKLQALKDS